MIEIGGKGKMSTSEAPKMGKRLISKRWKDATLSKKTPGCKDATLSKRKKKRRRGGKIERVEKNIGQGFREVGYGWHAVAVEAKQASGSKQVVGEWEDRVEKRRNEIAPMMERKSVKKGSKSRQVPSGVKKGRGRFRVGKWVSEGLQGKQGKGLGMVKGCVLVLGGRCNEVTKEGRKRNDGRRRQRRVEK